MFDFEKSFSKYLMAEMREHNISTEQLEEDIALLNEKWFNLPQQELGGKSASEHISECTDGKLLCEYIKMQAEVGVLPEIFEQARVQSSAEQPLVELLGSDNLSVSKVALSILSSRAGKLPLESMLDYVIKHNGAYGIEDIANSIDGNEDETHKVIALSSGCDENGKLIIGEILSYCSHSKCVFDYLISLFYDGDNIPFVVGLLARYGDIRAIKAFKEYATDCNYAEYREIKMAVEMLGDMIDDTRDFSDDAYYQMICNVDKKNGK